jgi:hypothetical protein
MLSVPWDWTDLPIAPSQQAPETDENATVLLLPMALRALMRRVRELRERDHGSLSS